MREKVSLKCLQGICLAVALFIILDHKWKFLSQPEIRRFVHETCSAGSDLPLLLHCRLVVLGAKLSP